MRNCCVSAYCSTMLFILLSATQLQGSLLEVDWKNPGDKLLTRDTATNLEWLDVTESRNKTKDFVLTQFGIGGQYEGFRYATPLEVGTFWSHGGVAGYATTEGGVSGIVDDAAAAVLIQLWGPTVNDGVVQEARAITSEANSGNAALSNAASLLLLISTGDVSGGTSWKFSHNGGFSNSTGHALVRNLIIPEPSTLFLTTLAIASALIQRRR